MKSMLFVCLGNICRSPTAKAVFDHRIARSGLDIETDSAGTIGFHAGSPPDSRAVEVARRQGLDLTDQRARVVTASDFETFDRIYAMDRSNLAELHRMAPPGASARIDLIMNLAPDYGVDEVPDPYYGSGDEGFRRVFDMLEAAADRLIEELSVRNRS